MSPANTAKLETQAVFSVSLPSDLRVAVQRAHTDWDAAGNTARLWANGDNGWLGLVDQQLNDLSKFKALAAEIKEDGFAHFVLLGTGGSNLVADVFRETFGPQKGSPELLVLDSTDPRQVSDLRSKIDPSRTLFCLSNTSGDTPECVAYVQYFLNETRQAVGDAAGHRFVAVADAGSGLESLAGELGFRYVYSTGAGLPGCYSAFSDCGLVAHSAAGLDTETLLEHAKRMVEASKTSDSKRNPGVSLGLILGTATKFGRDKITLIPSRSIRALGSWVEQLLAETTAKENRGLIPVNGEPATEIENYGDDRVFAYIAYSNDSDEEIEKRIGALESAGQPVIRIILEDLDDIAQIMFQWQVAAVVAASVLKIDPDHQPEVEASDIETTNALSVFEISDAMPVERPIFQGDAIKLFADPTNAAAALNNCKSLGGIMRNHLDRLEPGDYFGLLAYLPMFPEYEDVLQQIRKQVVESKQVATVLGFGPRFLHSTGQAYKGGPNSGVFLQITCDDTEDLPVPERNYTFGALKAAQAKGDLDVLNGRNRRVLRVHLSPDVTKGLNHLRDLICAAVEH
jgi:transaldolase / glucose-6-phosphate isomerase